VWAVFLLSLSSLRLGSAPAQLRPSGDHLCVLERHHVDAWLEQNRAEGDAFLAACVQGNPRLCSHIGEWVSSLQTYESLSVMGALAAVWPRFQPAASCSSSPHLCLARDLLIKRAAVVAAYLWQMERLEPASSDRHHVSTLAQRLRAALPALQTEGLRCVADNDPAMVCTTAAASELVVQLARVGSSSRRATFGFCLPG
jgi:hypothetical protein